MHWLVNEALIQCVLPCSGHFRGTKKLGSNGGKEYDDASVPVDWQARSWLDGDTLHRGLVSDIYPNNGLLVVCDCYHSDSAIEPRYVHRPGFNANANFMDRDQGLHQPPGSHPHSSTRCLPHSDKTNDARVLVR